MTRHVDALVVEVGETYENLKKKKTNHGHIVMTLWRHELRPYNTKTLLPHLNKLGESRITMSTERTIN